MVNVSIVGLSPEKPEPKIKIRRSTDTPTDVARQCQFIGWMEGGGKVVLSPEANRK